MYDIYIYTFNIKQYPANLTEGELNTPAVLVTSCKWPALIYIYIYIMQSVICNVQHITYNACPMIPHLL